jgi:two-component system, LuxR family, sensor kinase FixL
LDQPLLKIDMTRCGLISDMNSNAGSDTASPLLAGSALPENYYAAIVEFSDDAIISKDLNAIVTSWNPAAERIFGYSAAEILGKSISVLAAPGREDEMPRILDRIKAGERIDHYETERRRKDGQIIQISLSVSPIRDDHQRIVGATKIARDITNARRARAELEEREGLLRSILETIPDAMIVIDERGIIQSFSATAERLFGFEADEVCGRNVKMLMPSPHQENHDNYLRRYATTGERRIIGMGRIVAGLRKDGSTFPMELQVGEVRQGIRRLFTGFVRDLTERQTAERRLQELQAELSHVSRVTEMGQMASGLAHELNQPLTAASNYLQAVRRLLDRGDGSSIDRSKAAVDSAVGQVTRAAEIIRRLRNFVKKSDPERRAEDVLSLIEEASGLALVGAKDREIALRYQTGPRLPPVLVDKIQIQQVMVNLIRNAIEAMAISERRDITIQAINGESNRVDIAVIDTGTGIAQEVSERLFEPFMTTKVNGMGVGLSLCRTIVEAHGGRLWVEPNPDGGSIFRFTVPVAD